MIGLAPPAGPLSVLCLGAHPDDVEIGCGGTLLELGERGDVSLATAILTAATPERRREAEAAGPNFFPGAEVTVLDLPESHLPEHWGATKGALEELAREHQPDLLLAPRTDDAHQDHRLIGTLATTVWRDTLLLHYEIPKWDGDLGRPTHYVPVSDANARRKVELLDLSYPSQRHRDWWDAEVFLGLMRLRGMESRSTYAEAFVARKVLLELDGGGQS